MYVYKETERWRDDEGFTHILYTVGYYEPGTDKWIPESDHNDREEAAKRVSFLNGNNQN